MLREVVGDGEGTDDQPPPSRRRRLRTWTVAVGGVLGGLVAFGAATVTIKSYLENHHDFGMSPPAASSVAPAKKDLVWPTGGPANRDCGTLSKNQTVGGTWGPDRPTFTVEHPSPEVTLNSITDNADYGDERPFFDVKSAKDNKTGGFCGGLRVVDGDHLLLRVYVENSGGFMPKDPDRNVAHDVALHLASDSDVATLRRVTAFLSSSNATPAQVYSTVELESDQPFRIDPVQDSGTVYSNSRPKGVRLDSDPWDSRALLGTAKLDGEIRPTFEDTLIVTYEVRITRVGS
jgi:hypothetical protein